MLTQYEIDIANEDFQDKDPDCPRLAFDRGAKFAIEFYQKEIEIILQKMNGYKERLAEIAGGIYNAGN